MRLHYLLAGGSLLLTKIHIIKVRTPIVSEIDEKRTTSCAVVNSSLLLGFDSFMVPSDLKYYCR